MIGGESKGDVWTRIEMVRLVCEVGRADVWVMTTRRRVRVCILVLRRLGIGEFVIELFLNRRRLSLS